MSNMYVNKVVIKDNSTGMEDVKIDLSQDTITGAMVPSGVTFHDSTGMQNSGGATMIDLTDTMMNPDGAGKIRLFNDKIQIGNTGMGEEVAWTSYKGMDYVTIAEEEQAKIIAENIKKDVQILGVTGTLDAMSYTLEDNDAGGQTLVIS